MSLDNLYDFITTSPDDRETCEEHGRVKPCRECQAEQMDYEWECAREDGQHGRR